MGRIPQYLNLRILDSPCFFKNKSDAASGDAMRKGDHAVAELVLIRVAIRTDSMASRA